jgi:hypothetical protein
VIYGLNRFRKPYDIMVKEQKRVEVGDEWYCMNRGLPL